MRSAFVLTAVSTLLAVPAAQASEDWKQPTVCEKEAISLQVVGLKRTGPGQLTLTFQAENTSNLTVEIGSAIKLFDDAGDEWRTLGYYSSPKNFPPGVKITAKLGFKRDVGGNNSKSATLSSEALIHVTGKAKNLGVCTWTVKNIPIE